MPLPFENQAVRNGIKLQLEEWINKYGTIVLAQMIKSIFDEKANFVSIYTAQASAASASASWSSSSTNCSTFISGIYVGPTGF